MVLSVLVLCGAMMTTTSVQQTTNDERMDWWREARFGMFIHWGLYAVPSGEWGQGTDHGEWIYTTAQIPIPKYEEFLQQFNPVKFDAEAWVKMAKDAGMKYIVITSKHHDGFALFDSEVSDYDIMATPFKRDIMKELAEACRKYGIKMCWYHSIMDWHHPDYLPRRGWEDRSAEGADFDRYVDYLHEQVTELLTNYGDIGVMWFDGEWESTWSPKYGESLYELCLRLQPDVIVNNRVTVGRAGMQDANREGVGDFGTPEQHIPAEGIQGLDWETCMTMGRHWGYNKRDTFKSPRELVRNLIDIASKGGNYLLNVGPRPDGTFPDESVAILKNYAEWMNVNGEGIYGTQASPLGALDWGRCTAKQVDGKWRLYLHVFDWPSDGKLVVPLIGNDSSEAWMLDGGARLTSTVVGNDIVISVPQITDAGDATVVVLELDEKPIVYKAPTIAAESDIFIESVSVQIEASSDQLVIRYTTDGSDPMADSPVYRAAFSVDETTVVQARAFFNGRAVSDVTSRQFERVAPMPASGQGSQAGLALRRYEGDWNTLPDFDQLTPVRTAVVSKVGLDPSPYPEYAGFRLTGTITVSKTDVYRFALTSDDGAKLWIDGNLIVDNDGLHGATELQGVAALAAGAHTIRVEYFNKTGGSALSLRFAGTGKALAAIANDALRHSP